METFVFLIFAFAVTGFFGGLFVGRKAVAGRTRPAMSLWLSVPFILIAIVLIREGDPAMSGADAVRNAPFAMVLYSFFLGIPWIVSSFVGLSIGKALRGPGRDGRG